MVYTWYVYVTFFSRMYSIIANACYNLANIILCYTSRIPISLDNHYYFDYEG